MRIVVAGGVYFFLVFACGFVLGAIRVTFVAPAVGALGATFIELPVMLAISWWVARRLVAICEVRNKAGDRLAMGGVAFALLMTAEMALGMALGRPLAVQWHDLFQPPGLVGLAGQIVFGLMPLAIMMQRRSSSE